jgi:hypothetical protein
VPRPCDTDLAWLPDVLAELRPHAGFLTSHEAAYRKHRPGVELEHKITLHPTTPLTTLWDLATHVHKQIAADQLPEFTHQYRDPFQTWDFLNHLFHITAPDTERGYVSFIPTTAGPDLYLVKRKHFTRDAPARREQLTTNTPIPGPLEQYVQDTLGVTAHRLPTFRRVRYDVNVESLVTGNIFSILFDRCHLIDHPDAALVQCEIEYTKSRTLRPPRPEGIQDDLDHLTAWLTHLTEGHHPPSAPEHYSKLTWLTQQAPDQPATPVTSERALGSSGTGR